MRLWFRVFCAFGHHAPGSSALIWHDGRQFRCPCRGCRRTLVKYPDGWTLMGERLVGD
jgi:hypothetical protein